MNNEIIDKFCASAIERGATNAVLIHPSSVVTAQWVRLKCQFGCGGFGKSYCCPPDTPTPEKTRMILDSYSRAILFHLEVPQTPERGKAFKTFFKMLPKLEGEMFKEGFYRAFVFMSGPCRLCKTCGKLEDDPCQFMELARPSMEGCGIDVYQTARNNGFFIEPLSDNSETQNNYCLMLLD